MNYISKNSRIHNIKMFVINIIDLFRTKVRQQLKEQKEELNELQNKLDKLNREVILQKVLLFYLRNDDTQFKTEIKFLEQIGRIEVFPYRQIKYLTNAQVFMDHSKQMPYVLHNQKKLYFPKSFSEAHALKIYKNFIESENLLGGNYIEKAPHQYQSEKVFVKKNDIVLDIGCAEGLFALDVIDLANKVYLIENDPFWIDSLKATFEPYKDKAVIINKTISSTDDHENIRLDTLLKKDNISQVFIKIDIEGNEEEVLKANKDLLIKKGDFRITCCTYHRHDDARNMELFLKEMNFETEFSDGYMLFFYDTNFKAPFFRHGLIRAINTTT